MKLPYSTLCTEDNKVTNMRKGGIEASHLCMIGYKEMRKYIEKISKLERNLKNRTMVHTQILARIK